MIGRSVRGVIFICLLLVPLSAFAQIEVGVKAQLPFRWLAGSDWDTELSSFSAKNTSSVGFGVGVSGSYAFTDLFGVQAELLITSLGGAAQGTVALFGTANETLSQTFLEVPLAAKITFPVAAGRVGLYGGPELMLPLGSGTDTKSVSGLVVPSQVTSGIGLAASAGASYLYPVGVGFLTVDARLLFSLLTSGSPNYQYDAFTVMVGYGMTLQHLQQLFHPGGK